LPERPADLVLEPRGTLERGACVRLRALGRRAGLELEDETIVPIELDFDDRLRRGSTGPGARTVMERALAERPEAAECFRVDEDENRGRVLHLRVWMARWRR
jgi:hypothetical protein